MTPQERLETIVAYGFDRSALDADGYVDVRCSQCEALVISGVPCHEHRCPNEPKACRECGCMVPSGGSCCDPEEQEF